MKIKKVNDSSFHEYGRILHGYPMEEFLAKMQNTPLPDTVIYEPSVKELEELKIAEAFTDKVFGEMPIQIGYCNGKNEKLNAVEYHRCSEINIAVTDMILLLGKQQDISEKYTYSTDKIEAFYLPAGTMVELYATTLHYAPCNAKKSGFQCVVILPKGTNEPLEDLVRTKGEDKLLMAKNKWLIAHKDSGIEGAFYGLEGINITVKK